MCSAAIGLIVARAQAREAERQTQLMERQNRLLENAAKENKESQIHARREQAFEQFQQGLDRTFSRMAEGIRQIEEELLPRVSKEETESNAVAAEAYKLLQAGIYDEAEKHLRKALSIWPSSHLARACLVLSLKGQQKQDEATTVGGQLLKLTVAEERHALQGHRKRAERRAIDYIVSVA